MKGWAIFIHSVRLVFSNLQAAFQVSLVPYALSAVMFLIFGAEAIALAETNDPAEIAGAGGGVWLGFLLYGLVALIASLWIAVAWHRFVLLEEYPVGWVPRFHGGAIGSYFLRGLQLGLIILGAVMIFTLTVGLLLAAVMPGLIPLLSVAVGTYLFYRFCSVLPAAAVGAEMTFRDAWASTKDQGGAIAVLVIVVIFCSIAVQIPNFVGGGETAIGIAYSLVVNWFVTLIGASVLTTFYGHFIEGRAID